MNIKIQEWIDENIQSLEGKTVLITGANSGIGFEIAKVASSRNAKVILLGRSEEKINYAIDAIKQEYHYAKLEKLIVDLSDLEDISNKCNEFVKNGNNIDILINNAGIMATPYALSKQGIEMQFAINHLGHFLLVKKLMPILSDYARIINMSSGAHMSSNGIFKPNISESKYSRFGVYAETKLANILFTQKLNEIFESNNSNKISFVVHPGLSATNLFQMGFLTNLLTPILKPFLQFVGQSALMGATGALLTAFGDKEKLHTDKIYGPYLYNGASWRKGFPVESEIKPEIVKPELKNELWNLSEELIKDFV